MNNDIRSLHINTEPTWRGGELQTLYLLEGLARRGFRVFLCAQKGSPLAERARAANIETAEVQMRGEIDIFAAAKISRLIKRFDPALVHYHTSHAHTLGAMACWLRGYKRPRTLLTRRVDFSIYRHSFLGLNHLKYRVVDHIVTISRAILAVLLADGLPPDNIDCVPSGVDPKRFSDVKPVDLRSELGLPSDIKLVGNIAFFADHKGQRYLVEAAPTILERFPNCAIVLIGEGGLRKPLMKLAKQLGVEDRVLFPGFRNDVPAILRSLDVYAMPSHQEGLGTAILDALCCGVPVVASDAGGIPEVVHHDVNGLLVPPQRSPELAEAILRVLTNEEEAARYSAAGPVTIEREYTVDRMVDGNIEVYRKLVKSPSG